MPRPFSEPVERFRDEVRAFVASRDWGRGYFHEERDSPACLRRVYRELGRRGWLALTWPEEHGGRGLSAEYEYVLWDELAYARIARPPMGCGLVAKALIRFGTDEQRAAFLPGLRRGEIHFGLGYSEPDAGSDLAAVRTRARRGPAGYEITGAKCWTSNAHWVDYLWTLCRTGSPDSRSRGLSVFLVPTDAAGVTVSPLPTLDRSRLNEVLFDGVRVPRSALVGAEGDGWSIVGAALSVERHIQFPPGRSRRDFEELLAVARGRPAAADTHVRTRLAELAVELNAVEHMGRELVERAVAGEPTPVAAAYHKLASTTLCQRMAEVALDVAGPEVGVAGTPAEAMWRRAILETIGGGSSEVMRDIIARRGLALGRTR